MFFGRVPSIYNFLPSYSSYYEIYVSVKSFFFNDQSNIFKTNRLNIKIYWSGTDQCSRVLRIKHGSHILSIFKHHYIAIYLYIYTFLYNHQSIRNNVFIIKIKNNFVFSHKKNKKWSPVYDDKESIKYT